jgi:TIR domain
MSAEHPIGRARIYVSFADEDRARAMDLVRWLNDSGWHVTADDRHGFSLSDRWLPPQRLETCDVILCVITPGWLVSKYCHQEYSYCAKRGRFVLPVLCELPDVNLLPPAIRALPRIDLRQNRMVDYLALREVLNQTGSEIGRVSMLEDVAQRDGSPRQTLRDGRSLALLLAAVALGSIAVIWLWSQAHN